MEGVLRHPRHSADHGGTTGGTLGSAGPVAGFAQRLAIRAFVNLLPSLEAALAAAAVPQVALRHLRGVDATALQSTNDQRSAGFIPFCQEGAEFLDLSLDVLGAAATDQAAVHLGELSIDGLPTLRALQAVLMVDVLPNFRHGS